MWRADQKAIYNLETCHASNLYPKKNMIATISTYTYRVIFTNDIFLYPRRNAERFELTSYKWSGMMRLDKLF